MPPRKTLARREPNGQTKRSLREPAGPSPTEIKRAIDGATAGLRDPIWGTMPGRLRLEGKLTSSQLIAALRWTELAANYSVATQAPKQPRSANLDPPAGSPIDPGSVKASGKPAGTSKSFISTSPPSKALRRASALARVAVVLVCEQDAHPTLPELVALKSGLDALTAYWNGAKRK